MAASDLANLFGLNNKQESMDSARINSFEPGTFKPIMAGPEVAQGVAAGLYNMGNAVFGAFDNKVREASRDDTAYATNEFLNTLQTAATLATPEELPTVIQTFSQVLDENPAILQDKGRTALNELNAQVAKNRELQLTRELKYAELAQEAERDQAKNALEAAKLQQQAEEAQTKANAEVLKANAGIKSNTSQELKNVTEALEKIHERETNFWTNNSSLIKNLAHDLFLTRFKATPGMSQEAARNTIGGILNEISSAYNISTSAEEYEKTVDAIYKSIFNDSTYSTVNDQNKQKLNEFDINLKTTLTGELSNFIGLTLRSITASNDKKKSIRSGLDAVAGYISNPDSLSVFQKQVVTDGGGKNVITLLTEMGVPPTFAQAYVQALAGTANVSDEQYKSLFEGMYKVLDSAKDNIGTFNDTTRSEVVEAFRKKFIDATGGNNADKVEGFADVFELFLHPDMNQQFSKLDTRLQEAISKNRTEKNAFITNAVVDLAYGGKGPSTLDTLIQQNQRNLTNNIQAIKNDKQQYSRYLTKIEQYGTMAYTPTVSDTPTTGVEVTEKLSTLNKRSSGMSEVSSSPMVTTKATFNYLLDHSRKFANTIAQVNKLFPEGMDIYDLVAAEAFVPGIYKDGKTNVATAFGNNIAANKDLQNQIRRYQNAGNWAAILDNDQFNEAVYNSVLAEGKKVRKKWGTLDPAQQIIDNLDKDSKKLYDGYSEEQKAAVKKNLNTYEFLAKYRGEAGLPRRKSEKYNLGTLQMLIRNNPMANRYSRFKNLTQIVPVK